MDETATSIVPRLGQGELCIGGPQLAREYYKRADLTEERFVHIIDGQRIYRTGDNVRMLADGTFEYLNRTDDQVKIRGLRVELEEITHVLRQANNNIKDISTLALQNPYNKTVQLVTFVTSNVHTDNAVEVQQVDHESAEWVELRNVMMSQAKRQLPDYMIPEIIIHLNRIPLSPAGKVDKRLLRSIYSQMELDLSRHDSPDNENQIQNPVSQKIINAFSETSKVPITSIHLNTNIHHLGIDSLSVSQASRLLQDCGLSITATDIMEVVYIYSDFYIVLLTTCSIHPYMNLPCSMHLAQTDHLTNQSQLQVKNIVDH